MNRMDRYPFLILGFVAVFGFGVAPSGGTGLAAQEAAPAAPEADFESALFAGSGGGGEPAPDAPAGGPAAAESAAKGGFDAAAKVVDAVRIERLVGGTIVADATVSASDGLGGYRATADLSGKLFAKLTVSDYGSLYAAYNAAHPFFQAYAGDGAAPPAADPYETAFELSELHYSFDIAKRLFVRIGNQLIAWGPSRVWTPVDFINLEKADSFADVDLRVGKPGLRLHLLLPSSNAFLFADFSALNADGSYGDPDRVNLGGRLDTTWKGFEFALTAYGGARAQARFGADFSGRLLGTTVYGELAYAEEYASYERSLQASFGFVRALDELKRWTVSAEGFYNSRGRDLSGYTVADLGALDANEAKSLYQGSFYAYAALSADKLLSDYLSSTLSAISNLEDRSYSVKFSERVALPRAVPFTFALTYAGGGAEKEFTRYAGDGAVSASLSTKIEF